MGFTEAIQSGFNNYVNFSGRASRPAYWWWFLFTWIVSIVAQLIDGAVRPPGFNYEASAMSVFVGIITVIVSLALLLPSIAVLIRRLHDTDRSGWWWLIGIIPLIGWIILIFFLASPGTLGENRYGPPPSR